MDRNKQIHVSIQRAIDDGMNEIFLFGNISDMSYFNEINEKFSGKFNYKSHVDNKQDIYDQITDVYHSSVSECLSYVKRECMSIGMNFHGNESTDNSGYFNISNDEIVDLWINKLI